MATTKLKVIYGNGDVVEVAATPRAQVETERFLRTQGGFAESTAIEASYRLAFESLRSRKMLPQSNGGDYGYEEWLDEVEECEELEPEKAADPTQGSRSPDSSSS